MLIIYSSYNRSTYLIVSYKKNRNEEALDKIYSRLFPHLFADCICALKTPITLIEKS